jgi:hypothetical protein
MVAENANQEPGKLFNESMVGPHSLELCERLVLCPRKSIFLISLK